MARSAYQLRMGLFRVVCTNGLIVSRGAFPAYCVSHRGNVVDEVVTGALKISERVRASPLRSSAWSSDRCSRTSRSHFAEAGPGVRFPDPGQRGMQPSQLLTLPADRRTWVTISGACLTACRRTCCAED